MKKQKTLKKTPKTNLSKNFHVYRDNGDMLKNFAHDYATMGKEFSEIANTKFDLRNPWDQGVLVSILTNMLACVEVNVELDGDNIEKSIKGFYEMHLEGYRSQLRESVKG